MILVVVCEMVRSNFKKFHLIYDGLNDRFELVVVWEFERVVNRAV